MVKLFCAIVGAAGGAFEVDIDEEASVYALKKAIREKPHNLKNVNADELQFFLAKTEGGAWLSSDDAALSPDQVESLMNLEMYSTDKIGDLFGGPPTKNTIHVLVLVPDPVTTTTTVQFLTPKWKFADKPCPVLNFQESNYPIIRIPKEYAEGSGLRFHEDGLRLYLRSEVKEEWAALNDNVVKTYAVQWIVGPPGTGKSCAAFAFACSLERGRNWDVLWIHCPPFIGKMLSCILFRGDSEKRTCVIGHSQVNFVLQSLRENAVVFVDGYTKDWVGLSVLDACRLWRNENEKCHRIVIVSSIVSMGKDYLPDGYNKIKTMLESSLESLAIAPPTVSEDTPSEMYCEQLFKVTSWTREDYGKALMYDDFFEHVRSQLTDSDGAVGLDERYELLDAKFFVAGGSARMMFNMSSETALDKLRWAISDLGYIRLTALIGNSSVNPLSYRYNNGPCLSAFVAREFAFILDRERLLNLVKDLSQNPSTAGSVCELWFFASLLHGSAHCHFYEGGQLKNVVWNAKNDPITRWRLFRPIERFDPDGDKIPLNRCKQWLAPKSWKQGSYDAVFIKSVELNTNEADVKAKKAGFTQKILVRFVPVTSSTAHSFKVSFYEDLLTRLVSTLNKWIYAVEVCFVVPIKNMKEFRLPMNDNDFGEAVKTALVTDLPTNISFQVLGLSYKLDDEEEVDVRVDRGPKAEENVDVAQKKRRN
ncbi:hypothetical protein V7S43_015766 [Phytophthora oleae]|uniref:Crinkler effector protein N-terminal domain-containing protein n=1 Tax=Phytophthora oleae TaxID=2107226 RepID=A0ABD3EXB7_9STRA